MLTINKTLAKSKFTKQFRLINVSSLRLHCREWGMFLTNPCHSYVFVQRSIMVSSEIGWSQIYNLRYSYLIGGSVVKENWPCIWNRNTFCYLHCPHFSSLFKKVCNNSVDSKFFLNIVFVKFNMKVWTWCYSMDNWSIEFVNARKLISPPWYKEE